MNVAVHFINEKSKNTLLKQNFITNMKEINSKGEYSLRQNFFDPSKSSPPNDFMEKLQKRMSIYNTKTQVFQDISIQN
jgi:hypothetical protein